MKTVEVNDLKNDSNNEIVYKFGNSTFYVKRSFAKAGSTVLEQLVGYLLDKDEIQEKNK